jgi:hypothetical protein
VYTIQSEQVEPHVESLGVKLRLCGWMHIPKPANVRIIQQPNVSSLWFPMEAMLHTEKISLFITNLTNPYQPLVSTSYQILIVASIRETEEINDQDA